MQMGRIDFHSTMIYWLVSGPAYMLQRRRLEFFTEWQSRDFNGAYCYLTSDVIFMISDVVNFKRILLLLKSARFIPKSGEGLTVWASHYRGAFFVF